MSVQNPYSDVNISVKPYFSNEGFEHDADSGPAADTELKEVFPGQQNGAAARTRPAPVANPYGSIYQSADGSGQAVEVEDSGRCPLACCRRGGCCSCCQHCLIS